MEINVWEQLIPTTVIRVSEIYLTHGIAENPPLTEGIRHHTAYVLGRAKREPKHAEYMSSYPSEGLSKIDLASDGESEHILDKMSKLVQSK